MMSGLFIPDTVNYMIAGYVVLTVILSIYLLNIAVRWRSAKKQYRELRDQA
jgi:hypothetical protein